MAAKCAAVARSRLVQFVAIGGVLFWIAPRPSDDRRIEVSRSDVAIVEAAEAARRDTASLSPSKASEVESRLIEDEMLYREGVRLGLDRDDPLVRQRVIQKVLLLAEDLGGAMHEPTRAEIAEEYERTRESLREPPRYRVIHVFANRAEDLPARASLGASGVPAAGEPFPLPRDVTATAERLARDYGRDFAALAITTPPSGEFSDPVPSRYGWHRIRVVEVLPGRLPPLDEVTAKLGFELSLHRREAIVRRYLDDVASHYDVFVDGQRLREFMPTIRIARRNDASAED